MSRTYRNLKYASSAAIRFPRYKQAVSANSSALCEMEELGYPATVRTKQLASTESERVTTSWDDKHISSHKEGQGFKPFWVEGEEVLECLKDHPYSQTFRICLKGGVRVIHLCSPKNILEGDTIVLSSGKKACIRTIKNNLITLW